MKVAFVATRISGTDGVSLEADHWRDILKRMGHKVTFVAGKLDRAGELIPELHFQYPSVVELHDKVVYAKGSYKHIEEEIFESAGRIEGKLRRLFNSRRFDLVITANVLSLPVHFPLAVALTRVLDELKIPTIARHHDFWWERGRYRKSSMFPFFRRWFPPNLANIEHVVINSEAKRQLKNRTGLESEIIWDSFDFANDKLKQIDKFNKHFREDFAIAQDDIVFLQATRIVPRKRIELSIELVKKLADPRVVLVLAGYAGDEAGDYLQRLKSLAKAAGIRHRFIGKHVNSHRRVVVSQNKSLVRRRIYTLWDCFANSDFVTYPTKIEGFGNQFVESVYFKKPVVVTPYPVFKEDIAPLGFEVIAMPGKVSPQVVRRVGQLMDRPDMINNMVEKNLN